MSGQAGSEGGAAAGAAATGTETQRVQPGAQAGAGTQAEAGTLPIGGADGARPSVFTNNVPPHLLGQTNEETIEKVLKENAGFRQAQSAKPAAFAKAEDVTFEWGEKTKAMNSIAQDDQALGLFKELAVKHKFSPEQMQAIPAFFEAAIEKGFVEPPFSADALLKDLAPADFRGTDMERQAKGSERLKTVDNWIGQLPDTSGYDKDVKQELRLLTTSTAGVRALELVMKAGLNPSVNGGGQGQGGPQGVTKADLEKRVADPRYWTHDPKYDANFAKETDELWKKLGS